MGLCDGHLGWTRLAGLGRLVAVSLAALGIAGCKVGPDYKRPETKVSGEWAGLDPSLRSGEGAKSVATEGAASVVRWWDVFEDATLTSLVDRATSANLDLAAAEARLRGARAGRDAAAAGLQPQVDANGSATRSRTRAGTGNLFRAGFDAAWEIDVFGGIRRGVEAADAGIRSAIEDERDVRVTVAGEVATTYCELRGTQRELVIARENLEAQKETLSVTKMRFEGGYIGGLDVAQAEAQVATTSSRIPVFESSIRGSMYALGVLLGQDPASLASELTPEGQIPAPPKEVPVGMPSDLLRRRPDIRRAEEDVHAATARVGVAVADLYPKFSITGSLGVQSGNVQGLGSLANRYWSIGPSVNWPLLDGGRIRANIRVQEALADETGVAYRKAVLTALQEVETTLVSFAREQERRASLEEAVVANKKAVELSKILYTEGKTDFLNVLNAQGQLFAAEDALVQSNLAVTTDLVGLYKALGGGWEEEKP